MRIGELAHIAGVSTKAIRYYEDVGLLPRPDRAPNGYRVYDSGTADRLRFIREAQATGLTLEEILSVLELRGQGASTCRHVIDLLDRHLVELEARIDALQRTHRELEAMIERARGLDAAECTDPNRCQTIAPGSVVDATSATHPHRAPAAHRH